MPSCQGLRTNHMAAIIGVPCPRLNPACAAPPPPCSPGEHPDHVVVIKYVPYVADSKRAMDEYTSEIFLGGRNTIVMHNTCEVRARSSVRCAIACGARTPPIVTEVALLRALCHSPPGPLPTSPVGPPAVCAVWVQDSLLAAPIIMDLVILAELVTRIQLKKDGQEELRGFHPVAVLLSYLTKVGGARCTANIACASGLVALRTGMLAVQSGGAGPAPVAGSL